MALTDAQVDSLNRMCPVAGKVALGDLLQGIITNSGYDLSSTTDGDSGADHVAMTAITETGAAATVQAIVEALVTRIKAVTDSASGADLVGVTTITHGTGATVQALLEDLVARVYALENPG